MILVNIDEILDLFGISDRDIYAREIIEEALQSSELSVVEAESIKHGRWIWEKPSDDCRCSNCGKIVDQRYPYCPWCKTKMDEVEEE